MCCSLGRVKTWLVSFCVVISCFKQYGILCTMINDVSSILFVWWISNVMALRPLKNKVFVVCVFNEEFTTITFNDFVISYDWSSELLNVLSSSRGEGNNILISNRRDVRIATHRLRYVYESEPSITFFYICKLCQLK